MLARSTVLLVVLCAACMQCINAFVNSVQLCVCLSRHRPAAVLLMSTRTGPQIGEGLSEKTLDDLWRRPKKELLKIGKGGVTESHVRSLRELIRAHTIVKVKLNTESATFENCLALAEALLETGNEKSGARLLGLRLSTRLVLLGESSFVDSLPKDERAVQ
jgi:RNA-binding protein YhbY